jgi:hypothetical protein
MRAGARPVALDNLLWVWKPVAVSDFCGERLKGATKGADHGDPSEANRRDPFTLQ